MTDTPAESAEAPRTPSEEELQEIERALRAATPGPWEADAYSVHAPSQSDMFGKMEEVVLRDEGGSADLELVAALRNAAPSLIAEVRKAHAALAARDARWQEALLQYEGCAYWIAAEQHSCERCAPLRALLSEGHDGK